MSSHCNPLHHTLDTHDTLPIRTKSLRRALTIIVPQRVEREPGYVGNGLSIMSPDEESSDEEFRASLPLQ